MTSHAVRDKAEILVCQMHQLLHVDVAPAAEPDTAVAGRRRASRIAA
jgi:hypothetical protein